METQTTNSASAKTDSVLLLPLPPLLLSSLGSADRRAENAERHNIIDRQVHTEALRRYSQLERNRDIDNRLTQPRRSEPQANLLHGREFQLAGLDLQ